jgi:H+-translocating NAD(P) transhydrogenase subunit alpha
MTIGILKEPAPERRVSILAESAASLVKKGVTVLAEAGAGDNAACFDNEYLEAGVQIKDRAAILDEADIILQINSISVTELNNRSKIIIGVYQPLFNTKLMNGYAAAGITVFSMDMLPRTTRAQTMDVLSSQANIAGYKAVLVASTLYPRYFPMLMTAAGSIKPAKVLILGAGVA